MSEIDDVIRLLDDMCESGSSRIRLNVNEETGEGEVKKTYHHGRCDVGSPWATGTIRNFGNDILDTPGCN